MQTELRFIVGDLEAFPDDGSHYEIIDGELFVSKQPHWLHQITCDQLGDAWRSPILSQELSIHAGRSVVLFR